MNLYLSTGQEITGDSFGAEIETNGEVVFTTGMTGYLETLTDPSYFGQIVVFTFPLIGNYGVFDEEEFVKNIDQTFESKKIWVKGVIMTEFSEDFEHAKATQSFKNWLIKNNIPALTNVDTRELTQILREEGCTLGSIANQNPVRFSDPLNGRYVPEVSPQEITILTPPDNIEIKKTIAFIDCGAKNAIFRNFLQRGVQVIRLPFDTNPFTPEIAEKIPKFDGIFFSNGPGDPETMTETIEIAQQAIQTNIPIFGICLGNQMLALAAGGSTKKMKYGNRGCNQPCQDLETKKCIITSQNHGYEVDENTLPADYKVWFKNLNDQSVEGIKHQTKPMVLYLSLSKIFL
jgi:carbamoyl-phosphate synthase small subunit